MKDEKVYIAIFTSTKVRYVDILAAENCVLTSNGELLFNNEVVGKISKTSIEVQKFLEINEIPNFVINQPKNDIPVKVLLYGVTEHDTLILGCHQILSAEEIALQERENVYKIEHSITRDFDGVSKLIRLTKEEIEAIYSKMDRIYKVMDALNDLNNNLDSEIEFESLTLEQKELLEIVQGEFESELMNDLGPVYNETISFHKEELKMAFPDLDFDVQQFA